MKNAQRARARTKRDARRSAHDCARVSRCVAAVGRHLAPYAAPEEGRAGKLRLDFNENTVGCSPAVLRALRGITREQLTIVSGV